MLLHAIVHFICSYTNGSASFLGKSYERINDGSLIWKTHQGNCYLKLILFNFRLCASDDASSGFTLADCSTFTEPLPKRTFKKIASLFLSLHHEYKHTIIMLIVYDLDL